MLHDFLARRRDLLALCGRCYERETVSYKAFDGVVDALARHLASLPDSERTAAVPPGAGVLSSMFPALGAVLGAVGYLRDPALDGVALRDCAFAALRELLGWLAARGPLALVIDDLQWADTESLHLLGTLFTAQSMPPCLLIVIARATRELSPEVAAAIDGLVARAGADRVALGPLPANEATALAARLLPADTGDAGAAQAACIAHAALGHPLFVDTLVRYGQRMPVDGVIDLDGAIAARVDDLEPETRALLEVAAVAAAPVPHAVVTRAAGHSREAFDRLVRVLRLGRLVRTGLRDGEPVLEVFHDAIRTAVVGRITPAARAATHRNLAEAMQAHDRFEPGRLAAHWREAGDPVSAARWAPRARRRLAARRRRRWG